MIKKVQAPVRIDFGGGTTDIEPFASKYHGVVLNAAIDKYIIGELVGTDKSVSLKYSGNIPTSSGLGTSGVMNLVWMALICQEKDKLKLANRVYKLEQAIDVVGGKQDQYTSAVGGINFLEFEKGKVKITKLNLHKDLIKKLESNLVLVYTGKPHLATKANGLMMNNVAKGKTKKNLIKIRDITWKMKTALLKKDLMEFAELMNQETEQRRKLHPYIVPKNVEKIIQDGIKNGAIAAKICGSGMGGSILFFGDKKQLKKKFGRKVIDFKFDFQGLRWV